MRRLTLLPPPARLGISAPVATRIGEGVGRCAVALITLVATTVVAAEWFGLAITTSTAVVITWWAFVFCATASARALARPTTTSRLARPALVLVALCSVAPWMTTVAATPAELVALGVTAVVGTAAAEAGAARLRRRVVGTESLARLVLAGRAAHVAAVVSELHRARTPRWHAVAACVPEPDPSAILGMPVLPDVANVADVARMHDAAAVLVLPTAGLDNAALRRLSWELERDGRHFLVETGLLDVAAGRTTVLREAGLGLLHIRPATRRGAPAVLKDVVDRLSAAALLLLLAPILGILAVAIRLDSRGPAIFKQTRVGRDGAIFTIYKFRTMTTEAEAVKHELSSVNESDGVLFKMRADPRITKVGRVLRKYSLDELPQLWNVVLGHMSLVGPRPALPEEVSQYSHDPRRRMVVKTGITGLWQVSGRSDLSWDESVRLDAQYVDNWSLGLDVNILWRTVGAVLFHRGAY